MGGGLLYFKQKTGLSGCGRILSAPTAIGDWRLARLRLAFGNLKKFHSQKITLHFQQTVVY